jgi:hypothetical protein
LFGKGIGSIGLCRLIEDAGRTLVVVEDVELEQARFVVWISQTRLCRDLVTPKEFMSFILITWMQGIYDLCGREADASYRASFFCG